MTDRKSQPTIERNRELSIPLTPREVALLHWAASREGGRKVPSWARELLLTVARRLQEEAALRHNSRHQVEWSSARLETRNEQSPESTTDSVPLKHVSDLIGKKPR